MQPTVWAKLEEIASIDFLHMHKKRLALGKPFYRLWNDYLKQIFAMQIHNTLTISIGTYKIPKNTVNNTTTTAESKVSAIGESNKK